MSIIELCRSRWRPDTLAVNDLTHQELAFALSQMVTWLLHQGLSKGDRICVQMPRSEHQLLLILAALELGCPVLPLNDSYTSQEVAYYLNDIEPKLCILPAPCPGWSGATLTLSALENWSSLAPAEPCDGVSLDDVALFLYTSGTTGQPKGAMITHGNLLATLEGLCEAWHWSSEDHLLQVLPLFHVHGLVVAQLGALWVGARTTLLPRFEPDLVLSCLRDPALGVTVFMAVPTLWHRLIGLEESCDLGHLRLCTSGSAPMPVLMHSDLHRLFGITVLERYGMTEVGIVLSNPYLGERIPGTVGFAVGDTRFRVVDPAGNEVGADQVGELLISGSSVIPGYWRKPEQTAETIVDGWLRSGDLASRSADGRISIVGRCKELIISGGMNVYPLEVERSILEHPAVSEVAVVGIADSDWGERVVAVVVGEAAAESEIRALVQQQLAPYKRPKRYHWCPSLPRNAMGKVQRGRIKKELSS